MQVVHPSLDNAPKELCLTVDEMQAGTKISLHSTEAAANCDTTIAAVPYFKYSRGNGAIIEKQIEAVAAFDQHLHNRSARSERVGAR